MYYFADGVGGGRGGLETSAIGGAAEGSSAAVTDFGVLGLEGSAPEKSGNF